MKTKEFLIESGIYPNMTGFMAILLCVRYAKKTFLQTGKKSGITTELYPKVANVLNSTPSRIERSIRYCIDKIDNKQLSKFNFKNRPTNSQFIYGLVVDSLVKESKND